MAKRRLFTGAAVKEEWHAFIMLDSIIVILVL